MSKLAFERRWRLLFGTTICFVVALSCMLFLMKPADRTEPAEYVISPADAHADVARCSEPDPEYLGDGAFIEWGADVAETNVFTETATVRIHGRESGDIVVALHVDARLGVIDRTLVGDDFFVPAGGDVFVPIDLDAARGLHPKQFSYPTKLRAFAGTQAVDSEFFMSQDVDAQAVGVQRVAERDGSARHGFAVEKLLARRITDAEEAARIQSIIELRNDPEDLGETGVFVPDVDESKPVERGFRVERRQGDKKTYSFVSKRKSI